MKVYYVRGFEAHNSMSTFNAGPFREREDAERAALIMLAKPSCVEAKIVKVEEEEEEE